MLVKTSDLTGPALDWAVLKANGQDFTDFNLRYMDAYPYSTDWAQGGPIIEREQIAVDCIHAASDDVRWQAWTPAPEHKDGEAYGVGSTPLIAAMRCYVASKLGDTVDTPNELIG